MSNTPTLRDGLGGVPINDLIVQNLNNGFFYKSDGNSLSTGVLSTDFTAIDGVVVGGESRSSGKVSGSINVSYDSIDHAEESNARCIKAHHALKFRGFFYRLNGDKAEDFKSGSPISPKLAVSRILNPIFKTLLGLANNTPKWTHASGSAYSKTIELLNVDAGATLAFELIGAPSGMTIGATTGVITWATPVAGTYEIGVKVSATVTGETAKENRGDFTLTVT